jgi:amino acid adenylation domain-containing protein
MNINKRSYSPSFNETNLNNIVEIFEEQVLLYPDRVAVIDQNRQFTYSELNKISNQLAYYLRKHGVKNNSIVGICLARSAEIIISMLSILKAGAAYLPIAPRYPRKRLKQILDDAQVKHIITTSNIKEKLPENNNTLIISIDLAWPDIIKQNVQNVAASINSKNLAYVIYTSGTTGSQKGVLIKHEGVVRLVKNVNYLDIKKDDVFLQLSPPEFDGSTFEIWGALLNGAKIVLMPAGYPLLNTIADKIKNYHISILFITTQLFNAMVEHRLETLTKINTILFGGEVASIAHIKKFLAASNKNNKLSNVYGPTECTAFATSYLIETLDENLNSIPIGKPISNTEAYIMNEEMKPVAVGAIGELYLGGPGVAKGYLNDYLLTQQKFIDNPFAKVGSNKLFKTGDVVKLLDDGNIQFLGRLDNQIKIRGFRIAPEEIEHKIKNYGNVKEAIVRLSNIDKVTKKLIAYIVSDDNMLFNLDHLKIFLQQDFPSHMMPNHFVLLEKFPLNSNGKVDFKQLNKILLKQINTKITHANPRNELETDIYTIWREELKLDKLGINDNFFDIGGDSLIAISVLDKFHKHPTNMQFHRLTISDLFKNPSISALALYISQSFH